MKRRPDERAVEQAAIEGQLRLEIKVWPEEGKHVRLKTSYFGRSYGVDSFNLDPSSARKLAEVLLDIADKITPGEESR